MQYKHDLGGKVVRRRPFLRRWFAERAESEDRVGSGQS